MQLLPGKKVYFASDFHLGLPMDDNDKSREIRICNWLRSLSGDAQKIYLVGDLFDAWIEYKKVVPRGFVRFLGTLAFLRDSGIEVEVFTGNHDLWMTDYFRQELDIPVYHAEHMTTINGKSFYIHHGDGLGPGDHGYKRLKSILRNPFCQWLYRALHPTIGVGLAQYFSRRGAKHLERAESFHGEDKEFLVQFCRSFVADGSLPQVDYFVFGHRHLALEIPIGEKAVYFNCGDWLTFNSYLEFDGDTLRLKYHGSPVSPAS